MCVEKNELEFRNMRSPFYITSLSLSCKTKSGSDFLFLRHPGKHTKERKIEIVFADYNQSVNSFSFVLFPARDASTY